MVLGLFFLPAVALFSSFSLSHPLGAMMPSRLLMTISHALVPFPYVWCTPSGSELAGIFEQIPTIHDAKVLITYLANQNMELKRKKSASLKQVHEQQIKLGTSSSVTLP